MRKLRLRRLREFPLSSLSLSLRLCLKCFPTWNPCLSFLHCQLSVFPYPVQLVPSPQSFSNNLSPSWNSSSPWSWEHHVHDFLPTPQSFFLNLVLDSSFSTLFSPYSLSLWVHIYLRNWHIYLLCSENSSLDCSYAFKYPHKHLKLHISNTGIYSVSYFYYLTEMLPPLT